MKFMKLGTRPDTFYTEEAIGAVLSDIQSDFIIKINNICYHLHKYPLLPKCGLLQRLCSGDTETVAVELHDIPGGEDGFELCAKFCYGITIDISSQNFVSALCAAKFLRMSESVERGNLVMKLEAFFSSCILEGWKDSIATLQSTVRLPEWSENLGIVRRCIDSVVEKILTSPSKVTWSFTYTRPGFVRKHQNVPRDWWTEDISDLDINLFKCIIIAIRATNALPPQLIGEALHVYACRWLPVVDAAPIRPPETSSSSQTDQDHAESDRLILESIVSLIPLEKGAVSVTFLLRLLGIASYLRVSQVTKTELINRSGIQLDEATVDDLLMPLYSSDGRHFHDIDIVDAVVKSYLSVWQRRSPDSCRDSAVLKSIRQVGKIVDSYLQVASRDVNIPVLKVVSLAEALPEIARPNHDDLYKAINIYLKEHPDLSKSDKKRLCRVLDCQKLSQEVCTHAVKNERLPLRTVVQVLFFYQERSSGSRSSKKPIEDHGERVGRSKIGEKGHQKMKIIEMGRSEIEEVSSSHQRGNKSDKGRDR